MTAEVDDGLVTLQGVVEQAYERSCAEAIVLRVPGVIGVKNELVCAVAKVQSVHRACVVSNDAEYADAARRARICISSIHGREL